MMVDDSSTSPGVSIHMIAVLWPSEPVLGSDWLQRCSACVIAAHYCQTDFINAVVTETAVGSTSQVCASMQRPARELLRGVLRLGRPLADFVCR